MTPRRPISPQQALTRLQDMCARAEHCQGEMRDKLRAWGISPADSNTIIEALVRDRYVDDTRFAAAFVRDKVRFAHWGFRKVRQALALKRVDRAIVAQAIADFDPDEYRQILAQIIDAKTKNTPDLLTTYEGRTRLYRFAVSRGFEPDLVSAHIRHLAK